MNPALAQVAVPEQQVRMAAVDIPVSVAVPKNVPVVTVPNNVLVVEQPNEQITNTAAIPNGQTASDEQSKSDYEM